LLRERHVHFKVQAISRRFAKGSPTFTRKASISCSEPIQQMPSTISDGVAELNERDESQVLSQIDVRRVQRCEA